MTGPAINPGQNGPQPHPTIGNLGLAPPPQGQPPAGTYPQQTVAPRVNQQMAAMSDPNRSLPPLPPMQQPQQQHPTMQVQPQAPQYQQFPPQPQYQGQYPNQPGQPQYQGQAPQAPAPQFQSPQGQRFEVPDNVILDGPNVPPELRGRTWGQARQIYTALASQYLAARPQAPQAPQPESQPQLPQAGRPQGPREVGFWADPEGTIARIVDQRVNSAVAPVVQQSAQQQAEQAMRVAASGISDWQQLYPEILTVVSESGARPDQLGDPRVWSSAADLARGRLAGRGQYQAQPGVVVPPVQRGPGAYVPAQVAPHVGQFFSEAPTPPAQQFGQPSGYQMSDEDRYYQQKSGLDEQTWLQWRQAIQVRR